MPETVDTQPDQKPHLWKPGQSGNPAGRPKGARTKLAEDFLKAMMEDFNAKDEDGKVNGIVAIQKVRADSPDQYVRALVSILPKELSGPDGGEIQLTEIRRVIVDPAN